MYIHQRDWQSAMAIAEKHDKDAVTEVMVQQAKDYIDHQNNLSAGERTSLQAYPTIQRLLIHILCAMNRKSLRMTQNPGGCAR